VQEVDDDSVSGHHQIVATSSTNRAAYVSEVCFWETLTKIVYFLQNN
jgi:hypothetical protein